MWFLIGQHLFDSYGMSHTVVTQYPSLCRIPSTTGNFDVMIVMSLKSFFAFAWIRVSVWWWLHVVQSREIFRSPDDVKIWTRPSQTSFSIFILFSTMLFSGSLLAFLANPILTLFRPENVPFLAVFGQK